MMMMMMKMTLPEAMLTKMATLVLIMLDFPLFSFSLLSLGATSGRNTEEKLINVTERSFFI